MVGLSTTQARTLDRLREGASAAARDYEAHRQTRDIEPAARLAVLRIAAVAEESGRYWRHGDNCWTQPDPRCLCGLSDLAKAVLALENVVLAREGIDAGRRISNG